MKKKERKVPTICFKFISLSAYTVELVCKLYKFLPDDIQAFIWRRRWGFPWYDILVLMWQCDRYKTNPIRGRHNSPPLALILLPVASFPLSFSSQVSVACRKVSRMLCRIGSLAFGGVT